MKVVLFICLAAMSPKAFGEESVESLLQQVKQLQAALDKVNQLQAAFEEHHHVITELKEDRRLASEDASITEKINELDKADQSFGGALDSAWLCLCGTLVMFMHTGFAMLETGSCRQKNASAVLMKNLINVCCGTLSWWSIGWAFAYGEQNGNGFIGYEGFFGGGFYTRDANGVITPMECNSDGCQSTMLSWFFQWAFCTAAGSIVSGAVAERVESPNYATFAFFMTGFIYPVVVAWTWGGGWLSTLFDVGYMDFAGSGVVHLTGGAAGLAGTSILGPRPGRWTNPEEFESPNLPLVVLGTFCLWFGWYGFNPGSTLTMKSGSDGALAAQVAMNTTLAAASGGIVSFLIRYVTHKEYDVGALCNGILGGLVSITAGCGNMECGSAFATGVVGAIVYQAASILLKRLKIDDPVDACPVHCFCGAWGVMASGLFDWGKGIDHYHGWSGFGCMENDDGSCQTGIGVHALAAQGIMILAIAAWSATTSGFLFYGLKRSGMLAYSDPAEAFESAKLRLRRFVADLGTGLML